MLFPLVNKPLIQWIFERLAADGIDEAILAVNALTQFYIRQQKPAKFGLKIRYSIDPPKMPLGTGGPIKKAEKLIGNTEPFIVLNGDIFSDINFKDLLTAHKKSGALATIALCTVDDPSSFGVAEMVNGSPFIKRFIEKPPKHEAPSNLINAGAYIIDPKVFNYIPSGRAVSIEREVFPRLASEGKLGGFKISGLWRDIGKPQEYLEANKVILEKHAKPMASRPLFRLHNPIAIDSSVNVGEKSVIGPYAIIGKNASIGKNVQIANCVIFSDAEIGDYTTLNNVIVGEGAKIGTGVTLSEGCVIGDRAKISDNTLYAGAICPAKEK